MELGLKIQFAAEKLFNRFGVRSVSMDDVSKEINISKKTLYKCFRDKNELISTLNEKHFMSVKSCWYFNIKNYSNRKIIVWIENNSLSEWNEKISEFAEIKYFNLNLEITNTPLENKTFYFNKIL